MIHRKGFVIVTALVIAATLSLMVGAFSLSVYLKNQIAMRHINSIKAYYLAWSGASVGYQKINYPWWYQWKSNPAFRPPTMTFSITDAGDNITVSPEINEQVARVRCTAEIHGVSRTIVCECDNSESAEIYYYWIRYALPISKWE